MDLEEVRTATHKVCGKGFIYLVDSMGNDRAVVEAARVSYKGSKVRSDEQLLAYLYRNKHTSPFEMVELKFHVKLPIFVARQWIRHRTANVNEISGRYTQLKDEFYFPDMIATPCESATAVRAQSTSNKQGSAGHVLVDTSLVDKWYAHMEQSFDIYNKLIEAGVSKELARIHLPLATFTEWYWKIDLHNLMHFLRLRLDSHAQQEIREYADVIHTILHTIVPVTMNMFDEELYNVEQA